MTELTAKQLKFLEAKHKGLSNAEAARQAGYPARSSHNVGYQLMQNPKVRKALERFEAVDESDLLRAAEMLITAYVRKQNKELRKAS